MIDRIQDYFKQISQLPRMLGFKSNILYSPGFCCIGLLADEVLLTYLITKDSKPEIQLCESFPYKKISSLKTILTSVVKKNNLEGVHCSWVLRPANYQLVTTDALPVTAAEFQEAIRWKIKDSLSYPVEDTVIDNFPLPDQKSAPKMITVVVSRRSYLTSISKIITDSGLNLSIIDIPELALRNIAAFYEAGEKAIGLLYLSSKSLDLIITQQKQIYLMRKLDYEIDDLNTEKTSPEKIGENIDKLSLEIQRSLDYYQSQWRQPPPTQILISSKGIDPRMLVEYFTNRLSLSIQAIDISKFITFKKFLTLEQQGKFLPVLGGVLREVVEVTHETTS